jgi:hypothetical protein
LAGTATAEALLQRDDLWCRERRPPVGDKGGKKDKNKSQKQMADKRDQKAKEKRDKQQPSMS